jgi:iron complex outermembrane receptor protein
VVFAAFKLSVHTRIPNHGAGLRGTHDFGAGIGSFTWKLGAFRTDNSNDILSIPDPILQGFGYFQNVGSTRRQGVEAGAD